jgi:hypothetical protein
MEVKPEQGEMNLSGTDENETIWEENKWEIIKCASFIMCVLNLTAINTCARWETYQDLSP